MNKFHILSLVCLIIGFIFFVLGFLEGDVEGGVIIVFPFIAGSGIYAFFGIIFIFIAVFLFILGIAKFQTKFEDYQIDKRDESEKKTKIKGGGVVLIGPIPIVFGSNWKVAAFLMVLAIIIIIISLIVLRIL